MLLLLLHDMVATPRTAEGQVSQVRAQCELTEAVKGILACGLVTGAANVVGWRRNGQ